MDLQTQKKRYQDNWKKYQPQFGSIPWESIPDFLYFIEIIPSITLQKSGEKITQSLKKVVPNAKGLWVPSERLHITLALPGRQGVHFEGNDIKFMEKKLKEILKKYQPFEIQLGSINCFPNVLFREVYDETGQLYQLHNEICHTIPFSEKPEYRFENYLPHMALFYGQASKGGFDNPGFDRKIPQEKMLIEKVCFGKAKNITKNTYQKQILKEFTL